jgi:RHS repeat-associated protein
MLQVDHELSLTTNYTLDLASASANTLAADANGDITFYLYTRDRAVAETITSWSFYLYDGWIVPRQLVNAIGMVTYGRSYTPWGEVMLQSGMGNFAWGYFGGLMDAATGLIYIGNGQYYDPATGRFLTPANQKSANPYMEWTLRGTAHHLCRIPESSDPLRSASSTDSA